MVSKNPLADEPDQTYMLASNLGTDFWNDCNVYEFIKEFPSDAFEIAKEHSAMLKFEENCEKYFNKFGFGSLVEDIHRLAYSSGNLVIDLCYAASNSSLQFHRASVLWPTMPSQM